MLDRAYILHTASLTCRAANVAALDQVLRSCGQACSGASRVLVGQADPADLVGMPPDQLRGLYDLSPDKCPVPSYAARVPGVLSLQQLSNSLKHVLALADYAKESQPGVGGVGLVLEDDCLPVAASGLDGRLSAAARELRGVQGPAVCFLGAGGEEDGPGRSDLAPLDVGSAPPPACDSYLFNHEAAVALAAAYVPVRFPALEQLCHLCVARGVRVFRTPRDLFRDGSKTGGFVSSLNGGRNRLVFNDRFLALERRAQGQEEEEEEEEEALGDSVPDPKALGDSVPDPKALGDSVPDPKALGDSVPDPKAGPSEHPDLLVLLAAAAARRGRRARARDLYARALAGYEAQHCAVTSAWPFLGDYIALHGGDT
jgi:hypothetical protein